MAQITDVSVGPIMWPLTSLKWVADGARYSVLVNANTMHAEKPTLYKNPTVGRYENGYFKTRHLDLNSSLNIAAFNEAVRIAKENNLVAEFLAEEERKAEEKRQADADAWRLQQIKEAGPEMLGLLKRAADEIQDLADMSDPDGDDLPDLQLAQAIRDLIQKLEG